jgi:hypothetical protein
MKWIGKVLSFEINIYLGTVYNRDFFCHLLFIRHLAPVFKQVSWLTKW